MLLVIKTTNHCNLRCKYCYMKLSESPTGKMDLSTVEAIVHKFGNYFKRITFSWHGGEPLLLGKDFYSCVAEIQNDFLQKHPDKVFSNTLQTNGTLLTDDWYEHLDESGFGIGYSYDGPGKNNSNRITHEGKLTDKKLCGLFDRIKTGYHRSPHSICVLTRTNIDNPEEVYQHFRELGFDSFALLPYLGKDRLLRITPEEFFDFHKTIFDLWTQPSEHQIQKITPLSQILSSLVGSRQETICSWDGRCFQDIHCIDPDGNVYLCSALQEEEHQMGNILKDEVADLYDSKAFRRAVVLQNQVLSECKDCEVFSICNGGCREAAFYTFGDMGGKDPLCDGRKMLVSYIVSKFRESVSEIVSKKGE